MRPIAAAAWTGVLLTSALVAPPRLPAQGQASLPSGVRLSPAADTMDTWDRQGDQPLRRGTSFFIQTLSRLPSGDWQIRREWRDSLGAVTSVGTTVLAARTLATRFDGVRAPEDSAAVVFAGGRATGWVVPQGETPRLYDGVADPPAYPGGAVEVAFASQRPRIGSRLLEPVYSLYSTGPLVSRLDTLTATATASLQAGTHRIACIVIARTGGPSIWVDAATGRIVARRGEAMGGRIVWWHVRRGIEPPAGP